jgi:hypothetical protein
MMYKILSKAIMIQQTKNNIEPSLVNVMPNRLEIIVY